MKRPPHAAGQVQGSANRDIPSPGPPNGRARNDQRSELPDELAADELRRELRERGIVPIEPDERIRDLLDPGEAVVAIRRAVSFERRASPREGGGILRVNLYVTTHRLVALGPVLLEYPLADIREMDVAAGAVRLVVERNRGVELGVPDPRVLRVEIAAALEALRTSTVGTASGRPGDGQDSAR
jgi:hypothetical protein